MCLAASTDVGRRRRRNVKRELRTMARLRLHRQTDTERLTQPAYERKPETETADLTGVRTVDLHEVGKQLGHGARLDARALVAHRQEHASAATRARTDRDCCAVRRVFDRVVDEFVERLANPPGIERRVRQ